jgi:hypothetical protein
MYLHALKSSRQTSLMLKLEKRHGLVYYVAPLFHLPTDLSKNFFAKSVAQESRFFRPSAIGKMPDEKEHFVSFRRHGKPWRFSNDPLELKESLGQDDLLQTIRTEVARKVSARDSAKMALEEMLDVLSEEAQGRGIHNRLLRSEVDRVRGLDMPILQRAGFVARNFFDLELLTFGSEHATENQKPERSREAD